MNQANLTSFSKAMNARHINAVYSEQKSQERRGNPFLEALPTYEDFEKSIKGVFYYSKITEIEIESGILERASIIGKLKYFNCPFIHYMSLAVAVDNIIRSSYEARNPLSVEQVKKIISLAKRNKDKKTINVMANLFAEESTTDNMITLLGASGVGKSIAIKKILSAYPQIIRHDNYHGIPLDTRDQIVWLRLDAPRDGTPKELCKNFFEEIDKVLKDQNFNYTRTYANQTKTESDMLNSLAMVCNNLGLGILVIDEVQHLSINNESTQLILNFFTEFANKVQIPVVLVGNLEANRIFKVFRDTRRVGSGSEFIWYPMSKDKYDWNNVVKDHLWKCQILRRPGALSEEINEELYEKSQGIPAVLITLFMLSQCNALLMGKETLTVEIIRDTAEHNMGRVQKMLTQYKNNNKDMVFTIGGLNEEVKKNQMDMVNNIKEMEEQNRILNLQNENSEKQNDDSAVRITRSIFDAGLVSKQSYEDVLIISKKTLSENEKMSLQQVKILVTKAVIEIETDGLEKIKQVIKVEKTKDGIMGVMEENEEEKFSNALEKGGYIAQFDEF